MILLICIVGTAVSLAAIAQVRSVSEEKPKQFSDAASFDIKIVPFGPSQPELNALNKSLPSQPAVAALLNGTRYRRLYTELVERDSKRENRSKTSTRFRAIFYDYSNQRTIVAEGLISQPASVAAHVEPNWQPSPSEEEFQNAVDVLLEDPSLGPAIASGSLQAYHPMPPVNEFNSARSPSSKRIINVGLIASEEDQRTQHEIVGVDLALERVVRYPKGAPRAAIVGHSPCGVAGANQATTARGTAGQYQLTVSDGGTTLWKMLVIRPSVSSGTRGSAIELRNVKYRGRSVLKRAHVPILNIQYVDGLCGPYRDWQYQEGMFQATGADIPGSPGFRDCGTTPATTALENGTDTGNFKGIAVYREGTEVVLVSELEAGWYRYISEWRFDANGTIRPRFGFGATINSCTCQAHNHHVYFRFDFNIDGPINSIYDLPNKAGRDSQLNFLRPNYLIANEKKVLRNESGLRRYRIRGGERSYLFYPGSNDGAADAYGRGDMWFLRHKTGATNLQAEIDDGFNGSGPNNTEANLDQFLTNESLAEKDSVIWYHASFEHTPESGSADSMPTSAQAQPRPLVLSGDHVVGPDIVPEDW